MPIYLTHDNGGRPYEIHLRRSDAIVYKSPEHPTKHLLATIPYKRAFMGRSKQCEKTEFSGGYGPYFDGNTMLLQTSETEYVFIGHEVFSFVARAPIVKYYSPVGNNDVPYPWAMDAEGNAYLMLDKIVISAREELKAASKRPKDIYNDFWYTAHSDPTRLLFFGGSDTRPSGLVYFTDPESAYENFGRKVDQMRAAMAAVGAPVADDPQDKVIMIQEKLDGVKRPLSKEEYCALVRKFGETAGFAPFVVTKMIDHGRV